MKLKDDIDNNTSQLSTLLKSKQNCHLYNKRGKNKNKLHIIISLVLSVIIFSLIAITTDCIFLYCSAGI